MKNRTDKEQLVRCHDLDSEDISQEECHYLSQKEKSRVDRIKKRGVSKGCTGSGGKCVYFMPH